MRKSRPWLLDVNEAKSELRDQIDTLNTEHNGIANKLSKMNLTLEAISVKVRDNAETIGDSKDRVELVSDSSLDLKARLEDISNLVHERIDNVVNRSRDMSVAHEDLQGNLYEVMIGSF